MPTCPACAEEIPERVKTCPHCGISVEDYSLPGGSSGKTKKSSNMTIVWVVVGSVFVVMLLCIGILTALLFPAVQAAREAQCQLARRPARARATNDTLRKQLAAGLRV